MTAHNDSPSTQSHTKIGRENENEAWLKPRVVGMTERIHTLARTHRYTMYKQILRGSALSVTSFCYQTSYDGIYMIRNWGLVEIRGGRLEFDSANAGGV